MKRWFIEYLLKADLMVVGIIMRLFVAAAVLQVILAPMWDLYASARPPARYKPIRPLPFRRSGSL